MIETMVTWAGEASTAWWVLGGAAAIILVNAFRSSNDMLWGDMIEDDE